MMGKPKIRFKGYNEDWEQRKLGEIATYRNGKAHEANQLDVGTYELVNLNSISIDGGLKPSGKFIEDGGDTLQRNDLVMVLSDVGHGDLLGRVAIIPENNRYVLNQRVALLRINDDTNTYFLFSIINRYQDYFKKLGAGSSQLNISRGIVENFEVTYPNVAEQRMIADYFHSLDHLITLHQHKCDEMKKMKKCMLQKMFPQNGKKVPEIRFEGFTNDWEQRKLNEVAEFNPKSDLPESFEYVDLESVVGTEMVSHRTETKETAPSRAQRLAQTGDVFFQTVRPYQRNNYLFTKPDNNYVFSTGYAHMRPKIDAEFLMCFLQTDSFVKVVLDNCTGTSYPAINSNDLSNLEIYLPTSEDEQRRIGCFITNLDYLITLHQHKCDELQNLKKYMLQNMFV